MNKLYRIIAVAFCMLLLIPIMSSAQQISADSLVSQGIKLHDDGQYDQAVEKYQEALKMQPGNKDALYELALTYCAAKQPEQAILILNTYMQTAKGSLASGYTLLGTAYDDAGQSQKAIETYKAGIKIYPEYSLLYYDLSIAYYRLKNYSEAEKYVVESIRKDASYPQAHKLYGEIFLSQNKNVSALLAFCKFLVLEPKTNRSLYTLNKIDTVFMNAAAGKTYPYAKNTNATMLAAEQALAKIAKSTPTSTDPLKTKEEQLAAVFSNVGLLSAKAPQPKGFFLTYYADFFYQLSKANVMAPFVRCITVTRYPEDNMAWLKQNYDQYTRLLDWAKKADENM